MKIKVYLLLLVVCAVISCKKEDNVAAQINEGNYVVSASKLIAMTGNSWSNLEPQFKNKNGYGYIVAQPGAGQNVKAEVFVSAVDDSSKRQGGTVYLNILRSNTIGFSQFSTESLTQSAAYAMMLNYHRETLGIITGITNTFASYTPNNMGAAVTADTILSKLRSNISVDRLSIGYKTQPRGTTFTIQIEKQTDGRYIFVFLGNW